MDGGGRDGAVEGVVRLAPRRQHGLDLSALASMRLPPSPQTTGIATPAAKSGGFCGGSFPRVAAKAQIAAGKAESATPAAAPPPPSPCHPHPRAIVTVTVTDIAAVALLVVAASPPPPIRILPRSPHRHRSSDRVRHTAIAASSAGRGGRRDGSGAQAAFPPCRAVGDGARRDRRHIERRHGQHAARRSARGPRPLPPRPPLSVGGDGIAAPPAFATVRSVATFSLSRRQ